MNIINNHIGGVDRNTNPRGVSWESDDEINGFEEEEDEAGYDEEMYQRKRSSAISSASLEILNGEYELESILESTQFSNSHMPASQFYFR